MTRARDIANLLGTNTNGIIDNAKITLDAAEVPDLAASKITSGTFADARIAASNVSQHASSFDDNKIVNDISTLAIRQASNENKAAYNTNSMFVDVFQDDTGIGTETNTDRNASEYVDTTVITASSGSYETGNRTSAYTLTKNNMSTNSGTLTGIVDGSTTGSPFYWNTGGQTVNSNSWFLFDLGSGNSKIYTGAKWYCDNADTPNDNSGVWQWQGSNDNSNFTNLGNTIYFKWLLLLNEVTWTNSTAYRYIKN
jgi:hypothetical protein